MKAKTGYVRAVMEPNNAEYIRNAIADSQGRAVLPNIALLVAEVADAAIAGDNVYITIGITRSRDAILLTLNQSGDKSYAGGETLAQLEDAVLELL
jgi:hypothetical protein